MIIIWLQKAWKERLDTFSFFNKYEFVSKLHKELFFFKLYILILPHHNHKQTIIGVKNYSKFLAFIV